MKKTLLSTIIATALFTVGCSPADKATTESNTAATDQQSCDKSYYLPAQDAKAPHVDVFNYVRAETDLQMKGYSSAPFTFGQFTHGRKAYDVEHQVTLSANRDTIYSFGVFDLSKSDLTVTLPDSQGKYMTVMPLSQDHDIHRGLNAPGTYTFKQDEIGTRYITLVVRTLMDPNDPKDMERAHKLQDGIVVEQTDKGDVSGLKDWNEDEMLKMREAYNTLGSSASTSSTFFGVKCERSYLEASMGVAVGWGGMQEKDALYLPSQVAKNDGKTAYTITVPKKVPVDGFWSVTVYNQARFMVPNEYNSYSLNSITTDKNEDGTTTLRLGGDPKAKNYLYIPKGWLYIVRFYQPHQEILDGKWAFPAAVEVK
jgi:hypothetical protein